jgi:hypothetical protein
LFVALNLGILVVTTRQPKNNMTKNTIRTQKTSLQAPEDVMPNNLFLAQLDAILVLYWAQGLRNYKNRPSWFENGATMPHNSSNDARPSI